MLSRRDPLAALLSPAPSQGVVRIASVQPREEERGGRASNPPNLRDRLVMTQFGQSEKKGNPAAAPTG